MAKAKEQYDAKGGLVLAVREGQCACGCGTDVAKGRRYRQGHDARLRGMLGRAMLAGVPVTTNGKRSTAAAALKAHGFPEPPKPKAKKAKAEAKPKATKGEAKTAKPRKPKAPKAEATEATPEPETAEPVSV